MEDLGYNITETREIRIEGGCLIDGFPSAAFINAITTESMIQASQFEMAGIVDSESFPAISLIEDGMPNYPTRIFVNNDLKAAIFSSFLTIHKSMYRSVALLMLSWARKHKVPLVISSAPLKDMPGKIVGIGNTKEARDILEKAGIEILKHGAVPGIPGALLNRGTLYGRNVIVLLFGPSEPGPDFETGVKLCAAVSRIVPGVLCDIPAMRAESKKAGKITFDTDREFKRHEGMYS